MAKRQKKKDQADAVVSVPLAARTDPEAYLAAIREATELLDSLNAKRKGKSKLRLPIDVTCFDEAGNEMFAFSTERGKQLQPLTTELSVIYYVVATGVCRKQIRVRLEWERATVQ